MSSAATRIELARGLVQRLLSDMTGLDGEHSEELFDSMLEAVHDLEREDRDWLVAQLENAEYAHANRLFMAELLLRDGKEALLATLRGEKR